MHPNRKAFLDMLAVSEGTSTSPATINNGYDVIVTGANGKPEVFTDYSTHPFANGRPSKVINSRGLTSNASGRYQFMLRDWEHYRNQLNLTDRAHYPEGAFGPTAQDDWALQLIRERSALSLIDSGNLDLAINRVKNLWASLPGAGYGQFEHSLSRLRVAYIQAGGTLSAQTT